jgi:hypothetical protein
MENKISTIKMAGKILTKNITQQDIYINPVKLNQSNEITQFAKILKDNMAENLKIIKSPKNAKYFINGTYEILKDSIFITIHLSDINNNILKTKTITIDKNSYKNLSYKLKFKSFDESLNNNFIKSGKLFVNIGFKGYNRVNGIDLRKNDTVDIVVKTNKSICYFLLGHTLTQDDKFSYLLTINSSFINRITGNNVNQLITIVDNVPILAPFGNETLQIFASTFDKKGNCPLVIPKCIENSDEYCVIDGLPQNIISNTRALNLNKRKQNIEKAEDSISWTSFEK